MVGANRYHNPEKDLPTDFEQQREVYRKLFRLNLDKILPIQREHQTNFIRYVFKKQFVS